MSAPYNTPYTHLMSDSVTVSATHSEPCRHLNGWHITVTFLYFFRKRIYVCSDCGHWEQR
jgi:hypothetical protein